VQVQRATERHREGTGGATGLFGSPWLVLPIVILAAAILSIGISRDYRLKHEDNNALHAAFGRAHVEAGLSLTKGHDAYVNRKNRKVHFYAHHPPGCGLVLGGVFAITGSDRPEVVRGIAIAATLATIALVWWIVRREEGPGAALVAALTFAIIPQAAFYGRMVNHEVLALPFIVLVVDRYFALARGGGWGPAVGLCAAATVGALIAWVTFFALAACAVHAAISLRRRETFPAAGYALALLLTIGASLFTVDIAHAAWVKGGDLSGLAAIFSSRVGAGQTYGPIEWTHKMLGFSRRLATASGTITLIWLGIRSVRALMGRISLKPVEEFAAVFLSAGVGYLVVFNWGAWQHHYWQFPLLPAVVIALSLAVMTIAGKARKGPRRLAYGVLLVVVVLEVLSTSSVMLYSRHTTPEDRVIQAVEKLQSRYL
jgi:4-amino-4-deoxy-L-arabinose transferase-like glycosyltransferase